MSDLRDAVRQRAWERAYERRYQQPWEDGSDEGHREAQEDVTAEDAIEAMVDVLRPIMLASGPGLTTRCAGRSAVAHPLTLMVNDVCPVCGETA